MSAYTLPLLMVLLCLLAHVTSASWVQKGGKCLSVNRTLDCPFYNSDNSTFPFEVRMFNATAEPRIFLACDQTYDNDLLKVFNFSSSVVQAYLDGNNALNETLPMQIPRLSSIDNRRLQLWDVQTCHFIGRGVSSLPIPNDQFVHLFTFDTLNAVAVFPLVNRTTAGIDARIAEVKHYLNTSFPDLHYDQGLTWAAYSTIGVPEGQVDELWVTLVWPQPFTALRPSVMMD